MRGSVRAWLVPVAGLVAALAFAAPASAHAVTGAAASPATVGSCFASFGLQSYFDGGVGYIDPGSGYTLLFSGDRGNTFCQARLSINNTLVEIFDESVGTAGECLAWNAAGSIPYLHNATGCSSGTVNYMQWKFIYITADGPYKVYEIQDQYDGECLFPSSPDEGPCNSGMTEEWFIYIPLPG